jgi:hypothetical protein
MEAQEDLNVAMKKRLEELEKQIREQKIEFDLIKAHFMTNPKEAKQVSPAMKPSPKSEPVVQARSVGSEKKLTAADKSRIASSQALMGFAHDGTPDGKIKSAEKQGVFETLWTIPKDMPESEFTKIWDRLQHPDQGYEVHTYTDCDGSCPSYCECTKVTRLQIKWEKKD